MLFNSVHFLLFFPLVCIVFFLLKNNTHRKVFLLLASYYFYMCWRPSYALLILFSTVISYVCALQLQKHRRKIFLVIPIVCSLLILFTFKYFNFVNTEVFSLMESLGLRWKVPNLNILLPVGISFYTFQSIGYCVDVYRKDIEAEKDFITYALFVSFFVQLVAGPIERAKNLLPQFHKKTAFTYSNGMEGLKMMLWGYFMKLCVADRLAEYVDSVYNNAYSHSSFSIIVATLFFTFQIYCDFAGYSLIAKGAARIMGYSLMDNFRRPYLSSSFREFWKCWHISLSSWFMDYVYIPLGGSRCKEGKHLRNLFLTFIVSGLWHGANWTFLLWGALHGVYVTLESVIKKHLSLKPVSGFNKMINIILCFLFVSFAWLFFRANNVSEALYMAGHIFDFTGSLFIGSKTMLIMGITSLLILVFKDIKDEYKWNIHFLHSHNKALELISMSAITVFILMFGALESNQFIYFQF